MVRKVTAYIIRRVGDENRLLVFEHDCGDSRFPLQVPAGTIQEGEDESVAALREVAEESGLTQIELIRCLGSRETFRSDLGDTELRHFYLYRASINCPDAWTHRVSGDGEDAGMGFPFSWIAQEGFHRIVPLLAQMLVPDAVPELFLANEDFAGIDTHTLLAVDVNDQFEV